METIADETHRRNLGAYRIALGDLDGARRSATMGLSLARELLSGSFAAVALQHLALIDALQGNAVRSARFMGYVDAKYRELGMQRELTEKWGYDKLLEALRSGLSVAEIASLAEEGAAWTEDRAVEEALRQRNAESEYPES